MGRNLLIKEFDSKIGNVINEALSNGVDISVVVLTLDKYLFSAQATENRILSEEKEYLNNTQIEEYNDDIMK